MERGKESVVALCIQVRPGGILFSQDNDHFKARRVRVYSGPNIVS